MSDEWATDWHHEALLRQAEVTRYREALLEIDGLVEQYGYPDGVQRVARRALSPSSEKEEQ